MIGKVTIFVGTVELGRVMNKINTISYVLFYFISCFIACLIWYFFKFENALFFIFCMNFGETLSVLRVLNNVEIDGSKTRSILLAMQESNINFKLAIIKMENNRDFFKRKEEEVFGKTL